MNRPFLAQTPRIFERYFYPSHLRPVTIGRSDFRNQRFEPDTGKMPKAPLTLQKQGSEETPQSENAEKADDWLAENADDWL